MPQPTKDDIDALIGPATPHFAYQLRARVAELIEDLPAEDGEREPRSRPGWDVIPSSAPAYDPLPPRS